MKTLKLYGPPGTGKTRSMMELFEQELFHVPATRIAFLTFTKSARAEILSRVKLTEDELPFVKTIHAVCYKVLGIHQDQMISTRDLKNFGKTIGVEIRGVLHDPWTIENSGLNNQQPTIADRLLQLNHLGRHKGWKLKEMLRQAPTDLDYHFAKWFTETYKAWKKAEDRLDYTDLLTRYIDEGSPLDIETLFVDEGQDLSILQWRVVHKLGLRAGRRYLAGDDDQSIFTWAGASSRAFNDEDADETRTLPQSYRIPRAVHRVSEAIISRVRDRYPKSFLARDEPGYVLPVGFLSHEHLAGASTFVLFRNHYRGQALASHLEELGWPYSGSYSPLQVDEVPELISGYSKVLEGSIVTPSEAKAIVLYANMAYLRPKAETLAAITNSGISSEQLLVSHAKSDYFERVFNKVRNAEYIGRTIRSAGIKAVMRPSVTLMSIHQSKGREADTVVLDLEMSRRTYEGALKNPDDEHRVFYVGVTRAKQRLLTLLPNDSMHYQI